MRAKRRIDPSVSDDAYLETVVRMVWRTVEQVARSCPQYEYDDLIQEVREVAWRVQTTKGHKAADHRVRIAAFSARRKLIDIWRAAHTKSRGGGVGTPDTPPHTVQTLPLEEAWACPELISTSAMDEVELSILVASLERLLRELYDDQHAEALRVLLAPGVELLEWLHQHSTSQTSPFKKRRALLAHHFGWEPQTAGTVLKEIWGVVVYALESRLPSTFTYSEAAITNRSGVFPEPKQEGKPMSDPFMEALEQDVKKTAKKGGAAKAPKGKKEKEPKAETKSKEKPAAKGKEKAAAKTETKGKEKAAKGGRPRRFADDDKVFRTDAEPPREGTTRRVIYDCIPSNGIKVATLLEKAAESLGTSPRTGEKVDASYFRGKLGRLLQRGWARIGDK